MMEPVIRKVTTMLNPRPNLLVLIRVVTSSVVFSLYFFFRKEEYPKTRFGVTVVARRESASVAFPPGILKEKPSVTRFPTSALQVKAVITNAATIKRIKT